VEAAQRPEPGRGAAELPPTDPQHTGHRGSRLRLSGVASGYVGILSFDLHFPEGASLKGKRRELLSLKSDLQRRTGAAVAEVDHHELWQRARLTVAIVDRHSSTLGQRLDEAERLVVGRAYQAGPFEREVVTPEDLQ
jgi:uncharacterized protein YlxP (DUF503 family)